MKHLHYYLALLCLSLSYNYSSAQWQQTNGPTALFTHGIEKINNQLWVGTKDGVYTSANNGTSWQAHPLLKGMVSDVLLYDGVIMVAYLDSLGMPYIKTSFDNAQTWVTSQVLCCVYNCSYVKLSAGGNAVILQDGGKVGISYNYGLTWQPLGHPYSDFPYHLVSDGKNMAVSFLNHNNNSSVLFTTTNLIGGWQYIDSLSLVYGMYIKDSTLMVTRGRNVGGYVQSYICKSENLGATWDTVYTVTDSSILFDINKYGNKLYATGTGAVLSSSDNGEHWQTDTLPKNDFYDKIDLANGDEIGPHYPEGVALYQYTNNTLTPSATGLYTQYVYALQQHNNTLWASTDEDVFKSTDSGNTWQQAGVTQTGITDFEFSGDTIIGVTDNYVVTSLNNGNTWNYNYLQTYRYVPFKTIEYSNGTLYLSADSIRYSNDLGASWQTLPALPDTSNPNYVHPKTTGIIELFNQHLYAVNDNGYIFRYNQPATQWDILFKAPAAEHNELYTLGNALVASGYNQLWVTYDDGTTWQQPAMQGLPPHVTPHNLIQVNNLWLGTCEDYSVYASADSGNTWSPFYTGTPPFPASKRGGITVLNNKLFAGANYKSVWKYEGALEIPTGIKPVAETNMLVYPNPANNLLYIQLPQAAANGAMAIIYNSTGATLITQPVTGTLSAINTETLPAGLYTGSINSNTGINRFKFVITR